jgi:predicted GIY-YIG superfamily endonuclease
MELLAHQIRGWTYMMASGRNGTIYTGSTTDLSRRAWEHREKTIPGFTRKYGVVRLVWFEGHTSRPPIANGRSSAGGGSGRWR